MLAGQAFQSNAFRGQSTGDIGRHRHIGAVKLLPELAHLSVGILDPDLCPLDATGKPEAKKSDCRGQCQHHGSHGRQDPAGPAGVGHRTSTEVDA